MVASALIDAALVVLRVVVGVVVTAAGGLWIWRHKQAEQDEQQRIERLDRMETAIFGVDEVETIEGMVDIMESNYAQSEENTEKIMELRERIKELEEQYEHLENRIHDLRKKAKLRDESRGNRWNSKEDSNNE